MALDQADSIDLVNLLLTDGKGCSRQKDPCPIYLQVSYGGVPVRNNKQTPHMYINTGSMNAVQLHCKTSLRLYSMHISIFIGLLLSKGNYYSLMLFVYSSTQQTIFHYICRITVVHGQIIFLNVLLTVDLGQHFIFNSGNLLLRKVAIF